MSLETRSDAAIQRDVMAELEWEPGLKGPAIGVAVKEGVVTLSGTVDTLEKKRLAETATKRVTGVRAVAEDLQVALAPSGQRTDADIASAVVNALGWNVSVPKNAVQAVVDDGVVRLDGTVEWDYQRRAAEDAARPLWGVRGVVNNIRVRPRVVAQNVKTSIERAFERSARLEARAIQVETPGDGTVVLRGRVHSWAERSEAERAAWAAPGVTAVRDELTLA
jgi:osmotically-inducible protein OsmY